MEYIKIKAFDIKIIKAGQTQHADGYKCMNMK